MKKEYVTPVAREEVFLANNYVAACELSTSSTSTANKMKCINPNHSHSMQNGGSYYFAGVWVDADMNGCDIVVTASSPYTSTVNGTAYPAYGATVYGKNGTYTANRRRSIGQGRDRFDYYIPSGVSDCYGSYRYDGTYNEITTKVNS